MFWLRAMFSPMICRTEWILLTSSADCLIFRVLNSTSGRRHMLLSWWGNACTTKCTHRLFRVLVHQLCFWQLFPFLVLRPLFDPLSTFGVPPLWRAPVWTVYVYHAPAGGPARGGEADARRPTPVGGWHSSSVLYSPPLPAFLRVAARCCGLLPLSASQRHVEWGWAICHLLPFSAQTGFLVPEPQLAGLWWDPWTPCS